MSTAFPIPGGSVSCVYSNLANSRFLSCLRYYYLIIINCLYNMTCQNYPHLIIIADFGMAGMPIPLWMNEWMNVYSLKLQALLLWMRTW